jgi:hypothetical protein
MYPFGGRVVTVQRSKGKRRAQAPRSDELATGVAAGVAEPTGPVQRTSSGKIASTEAARELGRRGGRTRAAKARERAPSLLRLRRLLPPSFELDRTFAPYTERAEQWARAYAETLANEQGGGQLGPGVIEVVKMAAATHAELTFLRDLSVSGAWRWEVDASKRPAANPRTDLAKEARELEGHFTRLLGWAEDLAARAAKARPRTPAWPYLAAPLPAPSTTSTPSASTAENDAPDSITSGNAVDAHDDEGPVPSHDDGRSAHDDEGEEQARTTSAPTRIVEPSRPSGPSWLPPVLWPHAHHYEDMQKDHANARHAQIVPRTIALHRLRRLGSEEQGGAIVREVEAWRQANPLPPEETKG